MKVIITYGTFDIFHVGHLNLFERMRALGDRLVVGVSTDSFNELKGKKTIMPYEERARIISALKCVDAVFPENDWQQKRDDILREKADIFVMGSDWAGHFDDLKGLCQVIYLPRTTGISSTDIKNVIKGEVRDELIGIKNSLIGVQSKISDLLD